MGSNAFAATYYVRTDGSNSTNCTGTTDAAYPGSGTGQACALKHVYYATGWWSSESGGTYSGGASGVMAGGDTVIIKPGSYQMGYDAQFTGCSSVSSLPTSCIMRAPPSGTAGSPTKIFGCSSTGCTGVKTTYPELWGHFRVFRIINLHSNPSESPRSYIEVGWLNITDHSTCSEGSNRWNCGQGIFAQPSGWDGIEWTGSSNITLRSIWVHGMARDGLRGSCANCSILGSSHFDFNYSGYNQDTCGNSGTCGSADGTSLTMTGNGPTDLASVDWNGCVEDPNNIGSPMASGCQNGNNGGYGDGWGASDTGGTWNFEYVSMSHNTADGLDLKYHSNGNDLITFKNSIAVNNAGNQIKTCGNALFINNIIEGDCNFFSGKSYRDADLNGGVGGMANCNSQGDTWNINFSSGSQTAKFYGNTVVNSKGGVFMSIVPRGTCNGTDSVSLHNNIIQYTGYAFDGSSHNIYDIDSACSGITLLNGNNNINGFSNSSALIGSGGSTSAPNLSGTFDSRFTVSTNLSSSSPARNLATTQPSGQPSTDINGYSHGSLPWDIGAIEFGSSNTPSTCGNNTIEGSEVCDGSALNSQTCASQGFSSGSITCNPDCLGFNTSSCVTNLCGNSNIDGNEQCDTANLNGATCQSQGFSSGSLTCSGSCTLITSGCVSATCGNGTVDSGEQCDDGNLTNSDGCSSRCETEVFPYEKFLTYTDGDSSSYIDTHTNNLIYSGITRDANAYLRKDFGASYFGNFTHRFTIRLDVCSDNGSVGAISSIWAMSTGARTSVRDMTNNTDGAGLYMYCLSHSSAYQWTLFGNGTLSGAQTLNDAIPTIVRYVEVSRTGSTLTAKFYSDANYITQVGSTLTITDSNAYRYFYPVSSLNSSTSGTSISGQNSNYNLSYNGTPATPTSYSVSTPGCSVKGANLK